MSSAPRQRRRLGWLVGWVALCAALHTATATAEEAAPGSIKNIEERIAQARRVLDEMRSRYLTDSALKGQFPIEYRLQQGLVLLEVGDPARASVLFLDIVSRDEWKNEPGYHRAMYLLARSLFDSGYYASARDKALLVIEHGRSEDHDLAIELLIEIGAKTGNLQEADEIFAKLDVARLQAQPQLLYARGKGLYAVGRYAEAAEVFNRVTPGSAAGLRARYFTGVTRTRLGELEAAVSDFKAVVDMSASVPGEETAELVELAYLAKARIHYEREEWADALDTYQHIDRNSKHFDEALYEITWTHIRAGETKLALRNLDILIVSRPDSLFVKDAQRLQADLYKEAGKFERAMDTYEKIIATFEPVLTEIRQQVRGQSDPLAFFQNLVAQDESGTGQYLPRTAARWVRPDADMRTASKMVASLGASHENIEESKELLAEIQAAISSDSRYELFPEMQGAWVAGIEFETTLLGISRDLNEIQHAALGGPSVPARDERIEAQGRYGELPKTRDAYTARDHALRSALDERRLHAHKLRTAVEGAKAQIETMDRWLLLEGAHAGYTAEQENALRERLKEAHDLVHALKVELNELERDLRMQKSLGSAGSELSAQEAEVREGYRLALLREKEALSALGAEDGRVSRARDDLRSLEAELESFRAQVITVVDARVEQVRRRMGNEEALIDQYAADFDQLEGDVQLVAGEVAYRHWQRVENLFSDLVLAADVGVVDVAWLKKEVQSDVVDKLIEERNKERDILVQDFDQVLKELGQETGSK